MASTLVDPPTSKTSRVLHTMIRVRDLEASLSFYRDLLGLQVLRKREYPQGQFTLVFLGFQDEETESVIELTYNWDSQTYSPGEGFGHLAFAVEELSVFCHWLEQNAVRVIRPPGPMAFDPEEIIAFIEDPDGYQIELIERSNSDQ